MMLRMEVRNEALIPCTIGSFIPRHICTSVIIPQTKYIVESIKALPGSSSVWHKAGHMTNGTVKTEQVIVQNCFELNITSSSQYHYVIIKFVNNYVHT